MTILFFFSCLPQPPACLGSEGTFQPLCHSSHILSLTCTTSSVLCHMPFVFVAGQDCSVLWVSLAVLWPFTIFYSTLGPLNTGRLLLSFVHLCIRCVMQRRHEGLVSIASDGTKKNIRSRKIISCLWKAVKASVMEGGKCSPSVYFFLAVGFNFLESLFNYRIELLQHQESH